jgi:uroporphyrinogen-III synthase
MLLFQSSSIGMVHAWTIALTREAGQNEKFRQILQEKLCVPPSLSSSSTTTSSSSMNIIELPCIAHAHGPDYDKLESYLQEQSWDYITVTSPEAARVLASVWKNTDTHKDSSSWSTTAAASVVAVGKATQIELERSGIPVSFIPSKAIAKTLVVELEEKIGNHHHNVCRVLYPASAQAKPTLQEGLERRGFHVVRLNTYDTVANTFTPEQMQSAQTVDIVCFGSPSAVQGWIQNVGGPNTNNNNDRKPIVLAACIGETSARACLEYGWPESAIFYPESPGLEEWGVAVEQALKSLQQQQQSASKV